MQFKILWQLHCLSCNSRAEHLVLVPQDVGAGCSCQFGIVSGQLPFFELGSALPNAAPEVRVVFGLSGAELGTWFARRLQLAACCCKLA